MHTKLCWINKIEQLIKNAGWTFWHQWTLERLAKGLHKDPSSISYFRVPLKGYFWFAFMNDWWLWVLHWMAFKQILYFAGTLTWWIYCFQATQLIKMLRLYRHCHRSSTEFSMTVYTLWTPAVPKIQPHVWVHMTPQDTADYTRAIIFLVRGHIWRLLRRPV